MPRELTNIQLIEKIVRAKVGLENAKVSHKDSCASEDTTGMPVPCNCGASKVNSKIDQALRDLKLD